MVVHIFTSEIKDCKSEQYCQKFVNFIEKVHFKGPSASIIVSLGISRGDSSDLNKKILECNVILQHMLLLVNLSTFVITHPSVSEVNQTSDF